MNKLEQLIEKLCPNGVEYKTLGEVCEKISSGKNKNKCNDGPYPVYGSTGIIGYTNLYTNDKSCILIARVGANAGYVHRASGKFDVSDNTLIIKPKQNYLLSFLYYLLCDMHLGTYAVGGGQPLVTASVISKISVPVPPLPIQEEIVRILDAFVELETALEAELETRRKQYKYYRNELLRFDKQGGGNKTDNIRFLRELRNKYCLNGIEYKTLGEVCEISRGRVISKDYIRDNPGTYPVYSSQTVNDGNLGGISTYDYHGEYLTWTTDGANAGSVFYRNGYFNITNVCGLLKVKEPFIKIRFLFHWLTITVPQYVSSGMGNPKLMSNMISKIPIPIPPLPIQEAIVSILDRFDALVNDITVGLPGELLARRQQYEYYRTRLLTFK